MRGAGGQYQDRRHAAQRDLNRAFKAARKSYHNYLHAKRAAMLDAMARESAASTLIRAVAGETSWGPRLNWILYNAVRLAIDNNGTLLDIPTILTDRKFAF